MSGDPDSLVVVAAVAALIAVVLALRYAALRRQFNSRVQQEVQHWRNRELGTARAELQAVARQESLVQLDQWKAQHTQVLRQTAIKQSHAVTVGKVFEQLVPFLPHFPYNPKDARFVGAPVDFVVFDGIADGRCDRVVFVEVKTGGGALTARERRVRDAVMNGRVAWEELRIPRSAAGAAASYPGQDVWDGDHEILDGFCVRCGLSAEEILGQDSSCGERSG